MSGQRCGAGVYGSELVCHGVCVWCVFGVSVCRVCSCVFAFSVKEEKSDKDQKRKKRAWYSFSPEAQGCSSRST